MGSLIEDFQREGLLPERLVTSPREDNAAPPPKVNPDMPQATGTAVHDPADPTKADPTKPADQAVKAEGLNDTGLKTAVSALKCAECALEHVHGTMSESQYPQEKQQKIKEIYESIKQLSANIAAVSEAGNSGSAMNSPVQNQGQGPNPSQPNPNPGMSQSNESRKSVREAAEGAVRKAEMDAYSEVEKLGQALQRKLGVFSNVEIDRRKREEHNGVLSKTCITMEIRG